MATPRILPKTILTVVVLLALGFSVGFYSYVPIHRWVAQYKAKREWIAQRKMQEERFLGLTAPELDSTMSDGVRFRLHDKAGKVILLFF